MTAIDVSLDALALARENLELTGVNGRVRLVEHDLTSGLGRADFDLVVSNPPYVEPEELLTLQPEVRDWEPRIAVLDEGQTDAFAYEATRVLDGWLVLEVHEERADEVVNALSSLGYADARITLDLGGRARVVEARWRASDRQ